MFNSRTINNIPRDTSLRIPVHITMAQSTYDKYPPGNKEDLSYMNDPSENNPTLDEIYCEFQEHIVRKTKRFYIGGFKSSIKPYLIEAILKNHGVRMTMIRIFPLRNSQSVIIRLNVEAPKSHLLTENGFWPDGITCRPWVTKNRYQKTYSRQNVGHDERYKGATDTLYNKIHENYGTTDSDPIDTDCNRQNTTTNDADNRHCDEDYENDYVNVNAATNLHNHVNVRYNNAECHYSSYRGGDMQHSGSNYMSNYDNRWLPPDGGYRRQAQGRPHRQYRNQHAPARNTGSLHCDNE